MQGDCCSGFREFLMSSHNAVVPGQLCWHQDGTGVPHVLRLLWEWRKSEAKPGLPNMLRAGCQQGSCCPPSQSFQWVGPQGFRGAPQEHSSSWVEFGPRFTAGKAGL